MITSSNIIVFPYYIGIWWENLSPYSWDKKWGPSGGQAVERLTYKKLRLLPVIRNLVSWAFWTDIAELVSNWVRSNSKARKWHGFKHMNNREVILCFGMYILICSAKTISINQRRKGTYIQQSLKKLMGVSLNFRKCVHLIEA